MAVALNAGDSDDLPGSDLEVDLANGDLTPVVEDEEVFDVENRGLGRRRFLVDDEIHRTSDHHLGEFLFCGRRRDGAADLTRRGRGRPGPRLS